MKNFNLAITAIMSILGVVSMAIGVIGEGNQLVKEIKGGKRKWRKRQRRRRGAYEYGNKGAYGGARQNRYYCNGRRGQNALSGLPDL